MFSNCGPPNTTVASNPYPRLSSAKYAECQQQVAAIKGKPCRIIFIGDSMIQHFVQMPTPDSDMKGGTVWNKYYAPRYALNFGVGGDGTQDVLWRLENMDIKGLSPEVCVIMIGTNNILNTPEEIAAGVKAVVMKTRATFPSAKVILLSILPNARATQKMADANAIIRTLGNNKTIFYLDLAARMPRQGNSWKGLSHDRLHLSVEGYELWATTMEPLPVRLLQTSNGRARSTRI